MSSPARRRWVNEGVLLALVIAVAPALARASPTDGQGAQGGGTELTATGIAAAGPAETSTALAETSGQIAGRVAISAVTLQLDVPQTAVRAGQPVKVKVSVENQAQARVDGVVVTVVADPVGIAFRPPEPRTIKRIAPGGTEALTWTACGRAAGTYVLVATAAVDGIAVASLPQQLSITAGKPC